MFNVSWSECFVLTGGAFLLMGRKDMPKVAGFLGRQLGRVVGILQGARVRADRFTAHNELRQLQNELRSGLRELDAVRTELAVAASTQGVVGKGLGSTVGSVNRTTTTVPGIIPGNAAAATANATLASQSFPTQTQQPAIRELAPRTQSVAAVAEEEWRKQGIGFQSRAEQGMGDATGSAMLANLFQQSLIYDQHDRAVQEQDDALKSKVEKKRKQYDQKRK